MNERECKKQIKKITFLPLLVLNKDTQKKEYKNQS